MNKSLVFVALASVAVLSACGGGSAPAGGGGGGGGGGATGSSLALTLSAPGGVTPSVTVLGPGNYQQNVTGTVTLNSLTPGTYYLLPHSVRQGSSPLADTAYSADSQTVVVNGATAATVAFTQAPGSGTLWLGMNFPNTGEPLLLGYASASLASSNPALSASTQLGSDASVDNPQDLAFDAGGNLWVASRGTNQLVEYSVSQLGSKNPSSTPRRVLSGGAFSGPYGLAFDSSGGLWVSNVLGGTVVYFSAYTLASANTTLSADRTLQGFANPEGLAFDHSGDLWVADASTSRNQVLGFAPASISHSGSPTPDFTLTGGTATTPIAPDELAFDASGNLWVSTLDWLFRYPKADLSSADATPDVQLQTANPSYDFGAVAFDNQGNLWVTDFDGGTNLLLMYAPASQQSGLNQQVAPDRSFSGPDLTHPPYGLALNLAPANLPLQ